MMAIQRIPVFKTIEEAAAFWDTHDSADFEDEFELVTDVTFVAAQPKESITLRFEDETLAELTERARAEHTSPAMLDRRWILERLAATAASS